MTSLFNLSVKPLSVNDAWKGRRFKTDKYKAFEKEVLLTLKPMQIPDGELAVYISFGLSSKGGDIDNPVKPFVDVLQKKYGFNDSRIYEMYLQKIIVPKGREYIAFSIEKAH